MENFRNEKMRSKPGPKPVTPTTAQRRRIMRGIAIGLTLEQLATDIDLPVRTMRRVFASEIRTARVRAILDNLDRLHEAADNGNVSAMRTLASMMQQTARPEDNEEEGDDWADVIGNGSGNLARNRDFH
jgi:hypothetical protein